MDINNIEVTYTQELGLTPRESEIADKVVWGYIKKEIADMLFISYETVATHYKNICKKIGAKNVADVVRIVMKANPKIYVSIFLAIQTYSVFENLDINQTNRVKISKRYSTSRNFKRKSKFI